MEDYSSIEYPDVTVDFIVNSIRQMDNYGRFGVMLSTYDNEFVRRLNIHGGGSHERYQVVWYEDSQRGTRRTEHPFYWLYDTGLVESANDELVLNSGQLEFVSKRHTVNVILAIAAAQYFFVNEGERNPNLTWVPYFD